MWTQKRERDSKWFDSERFWKKFTKVSSPATQLDFFWETQTARVIISDWLNCWWFSVMCLLNFHESWKQSQAIHTFSQTFIPCERELRKARSRDVSAELFQLNSIETSKLHRFPNYRSSLVLESNHIWDDEWNESFSESQCESSLFNSMDGDASDVATLM